jgi:hypothetical protein
VLSSIDQSLTADDNKNPLLACASPDSPIPKRVQAFAVEALGVSLDDRDIPAVSRLPVQKAQVGERGPRQYGRPVLVDAIQADTIAPPGV